MAITWFTVLAETHKLPDGSDETNAAAWKVPEDKVAALGLLVGRCAERLAKLGNPETTNAVTREECNESFEELKVLMRDLHSYFYLKDFPRAARTRLGLGAGGEAETEDDKQVVFTLDTLPSNHEVIGKFQRRGRKSKSKGKHHAVEVRTWTLPIGAPPPANADAPGWKSYADTASPWKMSFKNAEDIGKRLYVSMRWEEGSVSSDDEDGDGKGKGPWSPIQDIVIP
jgi:hypothetical protein